jgi:hypothetical protein
MLLAGYDVEVEQDATTQYIRSLVTPQRVEPDDPPEAKTDSVEDALRRYEETRDAQK